MRPAKYLFVMRTTIQNALAYWTDFLGSAFFMLLLMFVFISLWSVIYGPGSVIDGFTFPMMIWYLVMAEAVIFSDSRLTDDVSGEIKSGHVAYSLNRPYHYVLFKYAQYMGNAILRFGVAFLAGSVLTALLVGGMEQGSQSLAVVLIVMLAITLQFSFLMIIGLLAFWFEDTQSFHLLYSKIVFTLGGMLIPLEFYPGWLEKLSLALPFSTIPYYPAKLFVSFSHAFFMRAVIVQLAWIAILWAVIFIIYAAASRRVQINGG